MSCVAKTPFCPSWSAVFLFLNAHCRGFSSLNTISVTTFAYCKLIVKVNFNVFAVCFSNRSTGLFHCHQTGKHIRVLSVSCVVVIFMFQLSTSCVDADSFRETGLLRKGLLSGRIWMGRRLWVAVFLQQLLKEGGPKSMNEACTPKTDGVPGRTRRRKGSSYCCRFANEKWLEPDAWGNLILLERLLLLLSSSTGFRGMGVPELTAH